MAICPRMCQKWDENVNILHLFRFRWGTGQACGSWEVWLGTWFALSSYHPLHVLQGQACRPQRVLFLMRLGSQKEAKGIISYPTPFSHCCLSIGVMLMPIILYAAARWWCTHQMSDTGDGAFCSPCTDRHVTHSLHNPKEKGNFSKIISFFFFFYFFKNTFVFNTEK